MLNEGQWIDIGILYFLAKKFITPFKKWKAYSLGLIDENGKRTNKPIKTSEEKNSYTVLDKMIRRIRVFIGDKWFLKLTLAYLLLSEEDNYFQKSLLVEDIENSNIMKIPMSSTEDISLTYVDNINILSFFITSELKQNENESIITSSFGSDNIPKYSNEDLLYKLNEIFKNILQGGFKEINVYNKQGEASKVSINYSATEFKIESQPIEDLNLGKFYFIFPSIECAEKFKDKWGDFYNGHSKEDK